MTLLTKFRDDTYIWTVSEGVFGPMTHSEMIAVGKWNFNISKAEILMSLNTLKIREHDVVQFVMSYYDDTYKIDYKEMIL